MKDIPTIESKELFLETKIICIVHNNQTYRLRITKENKLILTK